MQWGIGGGTKLNMESSLYENMHFVGDLLNIA